MLVACEMLVGPALGTATKPENKLCKQTDRNWGLVETPALSSYLTLIQLGPFLLCRSFCLTLKVV